MINIEVTVYPDEVVFNLDQIPRKLRQALDVKYREIFAELSDGFLASTPGKYLDPQTIQTGVENIGNTVIGFIEIKDKPGVYSIFPSKARVLSFLAKSGDHVLTSRVLNHPYPKGTPMVRRYLAEKKPWILEQLRDAIVEAI